MISLILLSLFFCLFLLLFLGPLKKVILNNSKNEKLTLIVPCRNESENISACIDALDRQNYDKQHLQILIVDDQSEDNSVAIIQKKIKNKEQFELLQIPLDFQSPLMAKARVIDYAIRHSKHNCLVICDADCMPQSQWLASINQCFQSGFNLVAGITLIQKKNSSLFYQMQNLDWLFLLSSGAVSANSGLPISCIGSNLAFKKDSYEKMGGFNALKFSLTEDLILFKQLSSMETSHSIFPVQKEMVNITHGQKHYSQFMEQRKRWFWGSFDLNLQGKIVLGISAFVHIYFSLIFLVQSDYFFLAIIWVLDILLLLRYIIALKEFESLPYLPLYLFFFTFNCFLIPVTVLFRPEVSWKNRKFNRKGQL